MVITADRARARTLDRPLSVSERALSRWTFFAFT